MDDTDRPGFPWPWLLPSLAVLLGLTAWGIGVYPELPERVPQHVGPDGVDAWTDKSVGAVFLPVFLYAGVTVVMTAVCAAAPRIRPADELDPGERTSGLVNRPATRVSALRTGRAVLLTNALIGLLIALSCTVMWRTEPASHVPGWFPVVLLAVGSASVVPVLVAAVRDRRDRRGRRGHPRRG
ncbi:hypothetical protein CUT44_06445 [Streptomyces carminius]|uniref:DUF1648 domain-containing protein n=1 Tax=Streptomyces carminius TaxID=2665496 RepID=A0A2M8M2C7_9ACTN|nr:DUF1648 domain-containing protein [Streptomyces carminius]PJE98355.1 hypothetical protein CUT44_06445 [Streptomyces carminius]